MAKKTQAQVEFKAVTSEFNEGIKGINGSLKKMQNELKLNSAQLKNNSEDSDLLSKRQRVLQNQYDATSQKIELTEKSLEEAKKRLGENSTEYKNLENALLRAKTAQQNVQTEINQTNKRLEEMKNASNDAENNIEDLSKEINDLDSAASNAQNGFSILKGTMSEFAGNVLTSITSKIGELAGELLELNEETKEFRVNLAKLDGASKQYGYSQEFTNEKIKEMYGYFQDEQVAVNAITNLQGLGLTQDELSNTLNAGIAVWTAYGDSIPIEGLTESINESAQVAKVTGSLADALNWAGISEDDFNVKLEKCNTTKERAQLITDTLNGLYDKSKATYDENTESIRENNEANMELIQAQAELGEAIEPVDTALTNLKATALEAITPSILSVANAISSAISAFQNLPASTQTTIVAIVGIATAIVTLIAIIGVISSVWGVLTGIFTAGIAVFASVGGAILAISTPVLIAVAVISTLIAIGITLYKNWDTVKAKCSSIWNNICNTISKATKKSGDVVKKGFDLVNKYIVNPIKSAYTSVTTTFSNIYSTINDKITSAKNTVKKGIDAIKSFFDFKFTWPHMPLPHFSINPPGWSIGDLVKGSIPSLGIKWYAKGAIMTQPTLFGGGEAGPEAVLPLNAFYDYLDQKLSTINSSQEIDYNKMTRSFVTAIQQLELNMDSKTIGRLTSKHSAKEIKSNDILMKRLRGE